jgi:hypothetical protein
MADRTLPKSANPVIAVILDDAVQRGVFRTRRSIAPLLGMTENELFARIREVPKAAWSCDHAERLMQIFAADGAPDLAARILVLLHPGLDVTFRAALCAPAESTGNPMLDESRFLAEFARLTEDIACAIEGDGDVDDAEYDRIADAGTRAQVSLATILDGIQARRRRPVTA